MYCSYGAQWLRVGQSKGYTRLCASSPENGNLSRLPKRFSDAGVTYGASCANLGQPEILKRQILGEEIASPCIRVNIASTVSFVQAVLAERFHQWRGGSFEHFNTRRTAQCV